MANLARIRGRTGPLLAPVHILFETAKRISAILAILAFLGFGSALTGFLSKGPLLGIVGAVTLLFSLLLAASFYDFLEKRPRSVASYQPVPSVVCEPELEIVRKEIIYEYFPNGQDMRQSKHFQVSALRDGVGSFPDRYIWTGTGKCHVRSLTPGFSVINERKEEFWNHFDVKFPHQLHKGDVNDFTIEWRLKDEGKTAVRFLSTLIDFPTHYLIMKVILPTNLSPRVAYCYEFANYIDTLPVRTEERRWDPATHAITYEVPQPKVFHKYLIRWE